MVGGQEEIKKWEMKSNYGSSLLLLSSFLYEIFSFRLGFSWDVIDFFKVFHGSLCNYYHSILLKRKQKPLYDQV